MQVIIAHRRISDKLRITPETCGYGIECLVFDAPIEFQRTMNACNTSYTSCINGSDCFLTSKHINFVYCDCTNDTLQIPIHYTKGYMHMLDTYFDTFKMNIEMELYLIFSKGTINEYLAHSDVIDPLKQSIMNAYEKTNKKYSTLLQNIASVKFPLFKDPYSVIDTISRYIKSYIYTSDYKKHIFKSDDVNEQRKELAALLIEKLFQNYHGNDWIRNQYKKYEIPTPIDPLYACHIVYEEISQRDLLRTEKQLKGKNIPPLSIWNILENEDVYTSQIDQLNTLTYPIRVIYIDGKCQLWPEYMNKDTTSNYVFHYIIGKDAHYTYIYKNNVLRTYIYKSRTLVEQQECVKYICKNNIHLYYRLPFLNTLLIQ